MPSGGFDGKIRPRLLEPRRPVARRETLRTQLCPPHRPDQSSAVRCRVRGWQHRQGGRAGIHRRLGRQQAPGRPGGGAGHPAAVPPRARGGSDPRRPKPAAPRAQRALRAGEDADRAGRIRRRRARPCAGARQHFGHRAVSAGRPGQLCARPPAGQDRFGGAPVGRRGARRARGRGRPGHLQRQRLECGRHHAANPAVPPGRFGACRACSARPVCASSYQFCRFTGLRPRWPARR